ncbi:helix-turn-helix domain-containing protein [Lonsdalea quercina]|uniref:helix-turn-helix domain-containing protein n=1 Tax=Lonsdalea quercina TaxID=71657 RepID=UPI0039767CED
MISLQQSISRLTKILSPHRQLAQPTEVVKGKRRYHFHVAETRLIYFIEEGEFLMKSAKDNRVICVLLAPCIVGWSTAIYGANEIYIERIDYGKIYCLPFDTALRVVTAYQRFDDVLNIVNYHFNSLLNYCVDNGGDSVSIVTKMLVSLERLPPDVRKRFTVLSFISQRTSLSKSTILRVIKKLQEAGSLTMSHGRLKSFTLEEPLRCAAHSATIVRDSATGR